MNVLSMGLAFAADNSAVRLFESKKGHQVRTLAVDDGADYTFSATETVSDVVGRIAGDWPVDWFVCWCPELFPPPREIERCCAKTAAIVSDWNVYFPQLEYNLARFDVVLTDKLGAETLRLPKTAPQYLCPVYAQQTPVHVKLDVDKDIDILFAGNLNHAVHVERGQYLEQVARLSDRYRVVIGEGYDGPAYTHVLNRARIVFNCAIRHEMNLRCFETLACGSLLFVEEDNLEIRDALRPGEELVLYNRDNLTERLVYYLEHPREAERVAARGHARARELAGENRLDALFDWLEEQPKGPRGFCAFSDQDQAFADVLMYGSSLAPSQRELAEAELAACLDRYPRRARFEAAAGVMALEQLRADGRADNKDVVEEVVGRFEAACRLAPGAAALWLNLAFACREAGAFEAEARFLEEAMNASSCMCGNILIGRTTDPYYNRWRAALAVGAERVETLWGSAAARLAAIRLEQGRLVEALELSEKAIEWVPNVAVPYRVRAAAARRQGDLEKAAAALVEALPLTAFAADLRKELVDVWFALGESGKAVALAEDSARIFSAVDKAETQAAAFMAMAQRTA